MLSIFSLSLGFVFTVQGFRLGGSVAHHLNAAVKHYGVCSK